MFWLLIGLMAAYALYKGADHLYWSPAAQVRRALTGRQRTQVRQIAGGTVRVIGKARCQGELLTAPITHRRCLAYQLRLEVYDGDEWKEALVLRDARVFLVEDETGSVLVEPQENFDIALVDDTKVGRGWLEHWSMAEWARLVRCWTGRWAT